MLKRIMENTIKPEKEGKPKQLLGYGHKKRHRSLSGRFVDLRLNVTRYYVGLEKMD